MRKSMALGMLMLAGCATAFPAPVALGAEEILPPPSGATVEPSGYATILIMPPRPIEAAKPIAAPAQTVAELAEARRRIAAQQALMPEFERLRIKLSAAERGNYTDARIVHEPDWAYLLFFKRDPATTLAKYTNNPRFKAAQGRYTRDELNALMMPWLNRFGAAGIAAVGGSDATYGTVSFGLPITEQEYRAIAAEQGWGPLPPPIKISFAREPAIPAVDPRVAAMLRHFASERRATLRQPEAGFSGRIFLRDGCLRVSGSGSINGPSALAMFHKETGIGLDKQGHLALIERRTGKPTGRIGEMFEWAGPNDAREDMPEVIALHAACGPGPVVNVGNPESQAAFDARYRRN